MKPGLKLIICNFSVILILTGSSTICSQVLDDTLTVQRIRTGIASIYNLEYKEAETVYDEITTLYPEHAVGYLFRGILTYWRHYPLIPSSPARKDFESDLKKCIELSEQNSYVADYEPESVLANVCARGMLLLFYADNDLSMNVIPLAAGSYRYVRRSFDFVSHFSDFYYFTGIYNYYREAYPRLHPVYKALAALFPPGDMTKGLSELVKSANESIFLKAESYSILAWIYTVFENNYSEALRYSTILTSLHPDNLLFRSLHIKTLLLLNLYSEAELVINKPVRDSSNRYYNSQLIIFNGLLQEKKYKNYDLAKDKYEEGIIAMSHFGAFGNEFSAYAYYGLSRISNHQGDKTGKQAFRRKGNELADNKKINFD